MCTSSYIKRHVFRLTTDQLFTTRDLLNYGSRGSIDQTIYRLIKQGIIVRIARGVFARAEHRAFSTYEIAKIKAESFGRKILSHAKDIAYKLQILAEGNNQITFATDGSSSSFCYGNIKIHFKKTSPRNIQLGDTELGQIIRAMSALGKYHCNNRTAYKLVFGSRQRMEMEEKLRLANQLMPSWLTNCFPWYKNQSCVWHKARKS